MRKFRGFCVGPVYPDLRYLKKLGESQRRINAHDILHDRLFNHPDRDCQK